MIIRKTGLQKQSFLQVMKKWGQDRQNYAATLFAKYPEAEGNVVRGEGVVRVSESKLRKIIAHRILKKEK